MSEKSRLQWLKDVFTNNSGLKLLALVLAAASFYAIRGATGFEIRYDVPLEVAVAEGIAILEQDVRTVQVTFRGSPDNLRHLEQKQIRAVVRPRTKALSGSERMPILFRNIEGATGVRVVKINPAVVSVTFDSEVEKPVEVVKPRTIGRPLMGKVELEYEPRFVKIRGPRLRLRDKQTIATEPVDVDGRVESFTRTVRVLPPSDTWVSRIEPGEITVRVKIVTETVARRFDAVPVTALRRPESRTPIRFDPPAVDLVLEGRAEEIDAVRREDIVVFVDCQGLDPTESYELPVEPHLPAGVDVGARVEPASVHVFLGGS